MTRHSPEPWSIPWPNSTFIRSAGRPLSHIAQTNWSSEEEEGLPSREEASANARRIVACINLCEHISTEELEQLAEAGKSLELALRASLDQRKTEELPLAAGSEEDAV